MKGRTLGLDIGSRSIGWALVETEDRERIVAMGVRVFPEGVDRDTKGMEKSKNATRREARGARRMYQRRADRKRRLVRTLREAGLLPEGNEELTVLLQKNNPYELRKRGLDENLGLHAFGRVLYHLSQRRGFRSNRKSGKDREDGVVIKEAGALQADMDAKGCRTLGEYFAGLDPEQQRIRERYTFRSMYVAEFDLLWEKQAAYHPERLNEDLRRKIRDEILFFQRPLRPTDELIGPCELEPQERRCPRADWYARRFRLLQDVNNLIIHNPDGTETKLSPAQRSILLGELTQKEKLTFDNIRKRLGLLETQTFNAEYKAGPSGQKVEALRGDSFAAAMRSKNVFGPKTWDAMEELQKIRLNDMFIRLEDDELAKTLGTQYNLNAAQVQQAMKASLPRGYMSFSRKAILRLLPFMESGSLTNEALDLAGYNRQDASDCETMAYLPLPAQVRNPIVQKALVEVRKVVNALVREHGKPARIKIEMAREVHGSRQQREELHWRMLEDRRRNELVRERLREDVGISNPSRDDVIKYKLWEECGRTCPYTGKQISQNALFGPNPQFQVEHILPYDRSLDDSYMNLTLCEAHHNIHVKRNQTPFEAYGSTPETYEQILQRSRCLPWPKRRRFLQREISLDSQISRELNDTRFICRQTVAYLRQLGIDVRGTRGKVTAELRHQWGLDGVFSELGVRRDTDHRRHAVDALVVALTDNEQLRRLAASKYRVNGERFPLPWIAFRDDTQAMVKQINVSHRASRKVSGALHKETNYGRTDVDRRYVFRKRLEDLSLPMVDDIVDEVVRGLVRRRLEEHGIVANAKNRTLPKEIWKEPLYMKTTQSDKRVPIKKVRVYTVAEQMIPVNDRSGRPYRYVEPGSNHHMEIFEYIAGPRKGARDAKVVSTYEAVRRSRAGELVVQRDHGPDTRFVCSLAINDMVLMADKAGRTGLYRVQKMSAAKQIYFRHHTASTIEGEETLIRKQATCWEGRKVAVDPLGRVWPAND